MEPHTVLSKKGSTSLYRDLYESIRKSLLELYNDAVESRRRQKPNDECVRELDIWSEYRIQAVRVVTGSVRSYLQGAEAALLTVRAALKTLSKPDEGSKSWYMKSYLRPIVLDGLEKAYRMHEDELLLRVRSERMVGESFTNLHASALEAGHIVRAAALSLLEASVRLYKLARWPKELSTELSACKSALSHIIDLASADIFETAEHQLKGFEAYPPSNKGRNKRFRKRYRLATTLARPDHRPEEPEEWYFKMPQLTEVLPVPTPPVYYRFRRLLRAKIRFRISSALAHGIAID